MKNPMPSWATPGTQVRIVQHFRGAGYTPPTVGAFATITRVLKTKAEAVAKRGDGTEYTYTLVPGDSWSDRDALWVQSKYGSDAEAAPVGSDRLAGFEHQAAVHQAQQEVRHAADELRTYPGDTERQNNMLATIAALRALGSAE